VSGGTTNSNGDGADTSAPDSAAALPSVLRLFHADQVMQKTSRG